MHTIKSEDIFLIFGAQSELRSNTYLEVRTENNNSRQWWGAVATLTLTRTFTITHTRPHPHP